MKFITVSTILASASLFNLVEGHARVFSLWVDGKDQGAGAGAYIRQPPNNGPVKDLTGADIMCNVNGATAVAGSVNVPAGSIVEPEWFHDNRDDDIIDGSHKGPIVTYLAPLASNGKGNVWVKIAEETHDGTSWPVDKIRANHGRHSVKIPANLAAGDYLFRTEILALHESDTLFSANSARGIQLYPSCSQITVTGSGKTSLPAGVSFPGAYSDADPGIHFNLYGSDPKTYVVPGPAVWDGVTGGTPAPEEPEAPASSVLTTPEPTASSIPEEPETPEPTAPSVPEEPEVPAPSPSAPAPSAPAPAPSAPAPSPSAVTPTKPATTPSVPQPTKPSGGIKDANVCMNEFNVCIAKSQPRPDWEGCGTTRDSCLSGATYNTNMLARAKRSGKFGRML